VESWTDEDFEMISVEVKRGDAKFTWEIIRIYRAPNEGMRVIERLAIRTDSLGKSKKRSIIGGDLNLPYADWKGKVDVTSGGQTLINRFVSENGYAQVVNGARRGNALLDVYLVRPESLVNSCITEQGIGDHCGVLSERVGIKLLAT
jgi:hypothetical protein